MGDHFQTIVDIDAAPGQAQELGARVVAWLVAEGVVCAGQRYEMLGRPVYSPGPRWDEVAQWPARDGCDGLAVVTGRTVFWGSLGCDGAPLCPGCAAPAPTAPWPQAVDDWYRSGVAVLRCPGCGDAQALPEWGWQDDRFALAHLGFEVWNAARLRPEFVAGFARILGHRIRTVAGRL
ncbi:hypothetical protein ACIF8W_36665 [Streptomyces sp. NPDC085639]|uniref:hypothetical protein n=1 Tax=Streptomyces sp. NPDC085639 TaxID=3365734 RepID=UPI0037D4F17C